MLRSRFESLPEAFNERLIPSDANKSKGLRAAFSSRPKVFVSIVRLCIMSRPLAVYLCDLTKSWFLGFW
jgi:hypothetical protein